MKKAANRKRPAVNKIYYIYVGILAVLFFIFHTIPFLKGVFYSFTDWRDANIGLFKPCAKKYDIDFTLRKDRTTHPPRYIVIFKSKQADNLEQAFKEFTAKKLQQQERPSIRKTLAVLKEKAAARSSQQAKEKIKERGLSR